MRRLALSCAIAIALAGGPAAADELADHKVAFHQIVQNLIDARNKGDVVAMAALFTRDAMLLAPGAESPIWGEANILRYLSEYAKYKLDNHMITPIEVVRAGPMTMVESGTWTGDLPGQDGAGSTQVIGTYLAVGVLHEGQWKLRANAWQVGSSAAGVFGCATPAQIGVGTPNR